MLSYGHGDRNVSNDISKMCSLAKAKYDNLAESPDELAFRKGDVLTVLNQKIDGLDGWWLCSFRGKQGIVPANRVTLLAGMYYESALRFSASPDSSISDGGGVDYDIPKSNPQSRQLPPLPDHTSTTVLPKADTTARARELLYDIPQSLQKTRVHVGTGVKTSGSTPNLSSKAATGHERQMSNGLYDVPNPAAHLLVTSAGAGGRRASGPISPLYKSGDSAVDVMSNRSSMMSNTSSPPGSSVCDSNSEFNADLYDVPSSIKVNGMAGRWKPLATQHQKQPDTHIGLHTPPTGEILYDVPKPAQDTLLDYRDSGIYDNARLSTIQNSPSKDSNIYDNPSPKHLPKGQLFAGKANDGPVYDVLPSHGKRPVQPVLKASDSSSSLGGTVLPIKKESVEMERLSLELNEAIEIIVKLQSHVHTSAKRLQSFVHAGWRAKSNLETILFDLKLACFGLQSTLKEFYEFGTGALANSASLADKTIMSMLSLALGPLKQKLDTVDESMKLLSGSIKWHIAKLEETAPKEAGGDQLMNLMAVAREVGDDVSRVASVIHGNSSLLFAPAITQDGDVGQGVEDRLSTVDTQGKCLVREDSINSYHEYDYCELTDRQDTPTNELITKATTPNQPASIDQEQDTLYLRHYMQHVHTICDTVKLHANRLHDIVNSKSQSNETVVSSCRQLGTTAHKLIFIGDTLCRSVRQAKLRTTISEDANALCNVLKEFILTTKDAALSSSESRPAALGKLGRSVKSVEVQTESFRKVLSLQVM